MIGNLTVPHKAFTNPYIWIKPKKFGCAPSKKYQNKFSKNIYVH